MTIDAPQAEPGLLRGLSHDLADADFSIEGVAGFLGEGAYTALNREQFIPALARVETAEGLVETLIRFFLLALPASSMELDAALPRTKISGLQALGLVTAGPGPWLSLVDLRPYAFTDQDGEVQLHVASDLGAHQRPGALLHDHVLGIGQASLTLAQSTIRTPVQRALDLGTGCGIQTFHLLRHARHVTATDISPRALAFTEFNLLLNAEALQIDPANSGDRVTLRQGSLLEPVRGERFDLAVSNPPFVITPRHRGESADTQYTYRDGGLAGDEIVSSLIRGLPDVLAPGGIAQLLGNWEMHSGDAVWHERLASWFGGECWVIQREQLGPESYAETWLQDASQSRDAKGYAAAYRDYLADFAERGVESVGFGMIWLRTPYAESGWRHSGAELRRFEKIGHPIEQPVGSALAAAVGRFDWLADHELPGARLVVATDVTEERHQRPGAEHPGVILLRQGAGLRRTTLLSSELAGFVSACDGTLTVGQIIAALEALLSSEVALLDPVRELVLEGFLLPEPA